MKRADDTIRPLPAEAEHLVQLLSCPSPMFEYLAQTIDHHRRSKDPGAWFDTAICVYFAADVVWARLRPALDAWHPGVAVTAEHELALKRRGPFAMLAGMAIENMLKGVIVQRERSAPRKTHDLVDLSERAGIQWSDAQTDVLTRLTTFITWAGRYRSR